MKKTLERYGVFKEIINCTNIEKLRNGFIDTLTHDLKTPVLAQIRVLELLLNGDFGEFNHEQNEILKMTLDSCKYMYEMVMTLISTYRFDGENFELNISEFDITAVCQNALKDFETLLSEKNIRTVIVTQLSNNCISADYIRIEKTIKALILNILNNVNNNSEIKIHMTDKRNRLKFIIESNNNYVSKEKMQQMFSIFTSDKGIYDKIGNGIGLYMVKKIIEKHNGEIIFKSSIYGKNLIGFEIPQFENSICKTDNLQIAYSQA